MKKLLIGVLFVTLLVACGSSDKGVETADKKIILGVVGEPYKYWDPVKEKVDEEGIELEIKVYSEYNIPNKVLAEGDIDVNAFQHYRYFNQEVSDFGYELEVLGDTILDPLGIYSEKLKDLSELEEGATVLIPDDVSNGGRALKLLEDAGLIEVDPAKGFLPSVLDITSNPKNLDVKPAQADVIPTILHDVDLAVINGDLAVAFGLRSNKDALYVEEVDFSKNPGAKELVNILAVRKGDEDREELIRLKELFQSQEVIDVFNDYYDGAFVPAWNK